MKPSPAERIVAFLSFATDNPGDLLTLAGLRVREWERLVQWLDDSGLAFYFLQKLKDTHATDMVPPAVLSQLERSFACNQLRVEEMSRRFATLNREFTQAGVNYVTLKGLSLIPAFCPNAPLRYQGDFDFLVDEQSLPAAKEILLRLGYSPKVSRSSREFIYLTDTTEPSRGAHQYDARAPHAVELHLDVWDNELQGLIIPKLFSVEQAIAHQRNGFDFPGPADEDAFLLQVLHAFHHLFTQWIRMSCLLEIGYFLNRRAADKELWNRVEQRIGDNATLREFVVVITELAVRLFSAPVPAIVNVWEGRIRQGPRVWIEHYARSWALCELPVYQFRLFPRSKLVLFLRQQYGDCAQKSGARSAALPSSRLARIAQSVKNEPSVVLRGSWWRQQRLIRRGIYYALASLRYACEIPRWLLLNREAVRPSSFDAQIVPPHRPGDFAEF